MLVLAMIVALTLAAANTPTDARDSVVLDGSTVSGSHMRDLFDAYQATKTSSRIDIHFDTKPAPEMPSYDPHWHYAGSHKTGDVIDSTVWISQTDADAGNAAGAAAARRQVVVSMAAGIIVSVMDSGFAGKYWKDFYDAEAAKDGATGTVDGDPFAHRRALGEQLAEAFL